MSLTPVMTHEAFDRLLNDIYGAVRSGNWQESLQLIASTTKSTNAYFNLVKGENSQVLQAGVGLVSNNFADTASDVDCFRLRDKSTSAEIDSDIENQNNLVDFEKPSLVSIKHDERMINASLASFGIYELRFKVFRDANSEAYSLEERQFFEITVQHFQKAMKLHDALVKERKAMLLVGELFNTSKQAMLLLDENCRVSLLNESAQKLIDADPIFSLRKNIFTIKDNEQNAQLRAALNEYCLDSTEYSSRSLLLKREISKSHFGLRIRPFNLSADEQLAIVIIRSDQSLDIDTLKIEYTLTTQEAKITKLYFQQHSIEEIARLLGCKTLTVRNHIQSIYTKFRVNSQTEFFSKLWLYQN